MGNFLILSFVLFSFVYIAFSANSSNVVNTVVSVDLMTKQNAKNHHTTMFYRAANPPQMLIVRRSASFNIRIKLKSPFLRLDKIQLHFSFETKQGTYNVYIPSNPYSVWDSKFKVHSNVIDVQITLPANVPVGFWDLYIYTYRNNLTQFKTYLVRDILILFNPFSPADTVYMKNKVDIGEYLLNEYGYIVTIDTTTLMRKPWIYGQFKPSTVQALKLILSKLNLSPKSRADPVKLSRAFSAIVNYQNDYGMMAGRWKGDFEIDLFGYKTRHPVLWMGSSDIFEEYLKNNGNVIGFAQCWVYAGVIVSLGRALGIPSRIVTNLESGHDYDGNATITIQFDKHNEMDNAQSEGIWNFHVWTEMWMKRYDLSKDGVTYGGWQVLDGTPQQPSYDSLENNGTHLDYWFQMGPASRNAVKWADVNLKYDTKFVYAEVNADAIFRNYQKEVIFQDTARIGLGTYGKGPQNSLLNLTTLYKEPEFTVAERASFEKALRQIYKLPSLTARAQKSYIHDFNLRIGNANQKTIGSVIDFYATVLNIFPKTRIFDVTIHAYSLYYNGYKGHTIFKHKYQIKLAPFSQNTKTILISPKDYIYKLVPFSIIRVEITVQAPQRKLFKQMFDIFLKKPALFINPIGNAVVGKPFYIDVRLINPLEVPLKKCLFSVHGLRLNGEMHSVKDVPAKAIKLYRFALVFNEPIKEFVAIQFTSAELDHIVGNFTVTVKSH